MTTTPISDGWRSLVSAISARNVNNSVETLEPISPDLLLVMKESKEIALPPALIELYSLTNGLKVCGYLPDLFSPYPTCTFSLIPAEEITSWHAIMMRNGKPRGGIWRSLPHWLKVLTMPPDADGIWNPPWIPFATDGAAGVQFLSPGVFGGVFQYEPSTFGIRRCSRSLSGYLHWVANKIRTGKLEVFNS